MRIPHQLDFLAPASFRLPVGVGSRPADLFKLSRIGWTGLHGAPHRKG